MTQETVTVETALPTPSEAAEEATPEGAAPEPTPEPPAPATATAWAAVTDPYDLIELDDVKPVLERRDNRIRDTIRSELDTEYAEKTRKWESTQAYQTISGHMGRIIQAIEDGNAPGADKVVERLDALMAPHATEQVREYQSQGASGAASAFAALLSDQLKGMDNRTLDDFDDLKRSGASWPKILDSFAKAHTGKLEAKYKAQLDEKDKQIEELKAGGRDGVGPNGAAMAASTGGGVGRPTPQQYNEATRQQREEWKKAGIEPQ